MRQNANPEVPWATPARLPRLLRSARRSLNYQLLVLMIRLGVIQPAQVRVRAHR
ncbi:hypothetical protein ATK74_0764 [Propionicimonas paludicola]|jgi:hypothetical protein|uniref:Uncharacterized protein n=1 Tax=Propionicimonas paludicola TaxID=185243 RepID=A0A2A9CRJ3_9ACTN|nr:hypothetical protein [Propionicimonas paludicola]PFG16232.1 hypothetical protein ATK74_0764 [Propionicimonas paludicola]